MNWIRRIVVDNKEPEDKDVLWIDVSDPKFHIIKIYDKSVWKPLIADRVVRQVPSYLNGYYVDGTSGSVDLDAECSVATVNIEGAKRIWFVTEKLIDNPNNYGYAFYDKNGNAINYYTFHSDPELEENEIIEFEFQVPVGAVTFRTTLFDKITEEEFHCDTGKVYVEETMFGGVGAKYNTTYYWENAIGYKPSAGEIIVYSDYKTITKNGETVTVPGIKIGSGNAYVQDLAFLGEYDASLLIDHILNTGIHVTSAEKSFWSNKLNVNDDTEVVNEILILNRE